MKYYVYNSRCQPLSLLIEEEIRWLADKIDPDDKIIIGIVNPSPSNVDSRDLANSWTRFKPEYNPLNYWERYCMISSFLESSGLSEKVEAIVPLARPSTNMHLASNYLPEKENRIMCLPIAQQSIEEDMKHTGMKNQGEEVFIIPSHTFPGGLDIISPELIFCLMRIGNTKWKTLVSQTVADYLEDHDISNRVVSNMKRDIARETLSKIYLRTVKEDDKRIIAKLLQGDRIKGVPSLESTGVVMVAPKKLWVLEGDLKALQETLSHELPSEEEAPETYAIFAPAKQQIIEYRKLISSCKEMDNEKFQEINQYLKGVKAEWLRRTK